MTRLPLSLPGTRSPGALVITEVLADPGTSDASLVAGPMMMMSSSKL